MSFLLDTNTFRLISGDLPMQPTLSCHNLTHVYGRGETVDEAVANVSAEFAAGEMCLLQGSGCVASVG